jgi:hypothetical protein
MHAAIGSGVAGRSAGVPIRPPRHPGTGTKSTPWTQAAIDAGVSGKDSPILVKIRTIEFCTLRGRPMTAAACFEMLATCRLNRYEPNELLECDYSITQPTQEQTAILRALGLAL